MKRIPNMRLLITGASGQLGGYLLRELRQSAHHVSAWGHSRGGELFDRPLRCVDLALTDAVVSAFHEARPTAILHLAAFSTVAGCHADPKQAERINVQGTRLLAELAAKAKARMVFISTDLVFDGAKGNYAERDAAKPLSVYGRSKLAGEPAVLATPFGVVARMSLMFGPSLIGRPYFLDQQLERMRAGKETTWFVDEWRSPLGLMVAARALLAIAESEFTGLVHVGGPERMSRFEMGKRLAARYGSDPATIKPVPQSSVPGPEPRPRDTSLDSRLWRSLFPTQWWPDWDEAMDAMTRSDY